MKTFFAAIICALSNIAAVSGACNSNVDRVFQNVSGECTKPVDIIIAGTNNAAKTAVQSLLKYGRFCGAGSNKCPGQNNGNATGLEVDACPLDPVMDPYGPRNPIDEACKNHDKCLDDAGNDPGSERVKDLTERCKCDVPFVFALAVSSQSPQGLPLCDEAYYTKYFSFREEPLFAANFCCLVCFSNTCDTVGLNPIVLEGAKAFCGFIDFALAGAGVSLVDICA
jgi:hypothetical protein